MNDGTHGVAETGGTHAPAPVSPGTQMAAPVTPLLIKVIDVVLDDGSYGGSTHSVWITFMSTTDDNPMACTMDVLRSYGGLGGGTEAIARGQGPYPSPGAALDAAVALIRANYSAARAAGLWPLPARSPAEPQVAE